MKASRFSDAQKAFILKQAADGMPVADICRKVGIRRSDECQIAWRLPSQRRAPVRCVERRGFSGKSDALFRSLLQAKPAFPPPALASQKHG